MPVSFSTHCVSTLPLDEALEALAPHTSHVELMNDGRHYIDTAESLLSHSFTYSIHAPARSVNIASVLEPMRKAAVEIICDSIELAVSANAKTVVFHPGYYAFTEEYEKAVSALQRSLSAISAYAEDAGVSACVENMGNWGYFFLKDTYRLSVILRSVWISDMPTSAKRLMPSSMFPSPTSTSMTTTEQAILTRHLAREISI